MGVGWAQGGGVGHDVVCRPRRGEGVGTVGGPRGDVGGEEEPQAAVGGGAGGVGVERGQEGASWTLVGDHIVVAAWGGGVAGAGGEGRARPSPPAVARDLVMTGI